VIHCYETVGLVVWNDL